MMTKIRATLSALGAIAFLALGLTALWYRGNAIAAEARADRLKVERDTALKANETLDKALASMAALRERENEIIADLTIELRDINDRFSAEVEAITDLEAANETVRDYLNSPIPDDLRRLYGGQ